MNACPSNNIRDERAALMRDFVYQALAPVEHDSAAAIYVARRYGLALPLARTIVALANIGRAFG